MPQSWLERPGSPRAQLNDTNLPGTDSSTRSELSTQNELDRRVAPPEFRGEVIIQGGRRDPRAEAVSMAKIAERHKSTMDKSDQIKFNVLVDGSGPASGEGLASYAVAFMRPTPTGKDELVLMAWPINKSTSQVAEGYVIGEGIRAALLELIRRFSSSESKPTPSVLVRIFSDAQNWHKLIMGTAKPANGNQNKDGILQTLSLISRYSEELASILGVLVRTELHWLPSHLENPQNETQLHVLVDTIASIARTSGISVCMVGRRHLFLEHQSGIFNHLSTECGGLGLWCCLCPRLGRTTCRS